MVFSHSALISGCGWAFDFSNPDAGGAVGMPDSAMVGDDATVRRVMEESRREAESVAQEGQPAAETATAEKAAWMKPKFEDAKKEDDEVEQQRTQSKKALIKQIEDKNAELLEQYLKEGPFVYELYAVMIH